MSRKDELYPHLRKAMDRAKKRIAKSKISEENRKSLLDFLVKLEADGTGKPDILIKETNLVVFIDGDFWHGKDFKRRKKKLQPLMQDGRREPQNLMLTGKRNYPRLIKNIV